MAPVPTPAPITLTSTSVLNDATRQSFFPYVYILILMILVWWTLATIYTTLWVLKHPPRCATPLFPFVCT
jgi:uncharacterized membrane protein (DUF106 family)